MKDKINNINPWFIAIGLAVSIQILLSLLAVVLGFDLRRQLSEFGYILSIPSMKIVANETVQAINEFAGDPRETAELTDIAVTVGLSMFLMFILTPFLLLKGSQQAEDSEDPKQRNWTWYAGAVLIISIIFPVLASSTIGTKVFMNTKASAHNSRQLDLMRSELMDLAFDASYKLFLPVELGGGAGSFNGFGDGTQPISLADLESYSPNSPFDVQIYGAVSDSSLTIVAVSESPGKKADFENVTGAKGRQQISVEITPFDDTLYNMQSSGSLTN